MLSVTESSVELTAKQRRHSMLHRAGGDGHVYGSGSAGPGDICQVSQSCLPAAMRRAQHTGRMAQFSDSGKQTWGGKKKQQKKPKPQIKARFAVRRKVSQCVLTLYSSAGPSITFSSHSPP